MFITRFIKVETPNVKAARTAQDLLDVLGRAKAQQIAFANVIGLLWMLVAAFGVIAFFVYIHAASSLGVTEDITLGALIETPTFLLGILPCLCMIIYSLWLIGHVKGFVSAIRDRHVVLRHALTASTISFEQLQQDYRVFNRSNIGADYLVYCYKHHDPNYDVCRYQYRMQNKSSDTDGDVQGIKKSQYRNGILIACPEVKGVALLCRADTNLAEIDGCPAYQPASIAFSAYFHAIGADLLRVSNTLKPAVVEAIMHIVPLYKKLSLEFSSEGILCFSWEGSDLFDAQPYSLDVDEFIDLLQHPSVAFKEIKPIIDFVETLNRYTDNNFAP